MGFIRAIFGFLIAIALAGFAIYNRQIVDVYFSPIHDPLTLPLYLIVLLMMAIGFVFGGAFIWLSMGRLRKTKRQQKKLIKSLEKKLEAVNENEGKTDTPSSEFFPALPKRSKGS